MRLPPILPSLALLCTQPVEAQTTRVVVSPHGITTLITARPTARCTAYRKNGSVIQSANCYWTSRNTAIASVTSPGPTTTITPRVLGTVRIIGTRSGFRDSLTLWVVKVDSVVMRPSKLPVSGDTFFVGEYQMLCAIARLSNGSTALLPPQDTIPYCTDRLAAYRLGL